MTLRPALGERGGTGMAPSRRAGLIAAIAICGLCEGWVAIVYTLHFSRWPWQDWIVYYGAARLYLDGHLPILFAAKQFTASLNAAFAAWLPQPFAYRSWAYPPSFLLLLLPFGLLPLVAACLVFEAVTLAGLVAALRCCLDRRLLLVTAAMVLSPPAAFNLGTGQNGFLTAALLVGGSGLLDRRPVLAGALLGLLSYKPQFWPLAALALIAARQWRALTAALATAGIVGLAALLAFGAGAWRDWLQWVVHSPAGEYRNFVQCCLLHDESVATNLTLLGGGARLASLCQAAALLCAGAAVWWCWRRPAARELRLAILLAATALAAPHVANYDAVLLALSAALLFAHGLDHGFRWGGAIVPVAAWTIQAFNPPDVFRIGMLTPLLTAGLIAVGLARCRADGLTVSAAATPG